jgi:hypothetical protein
MQTLQQNLKRLLTHQTTAINCTDIKVIHELLFHKAVYTMPKIESATGMIILGLGGKKGSKAKIKMFIKRGTINLL